jgi:hypothetical protein
MSERAERIAEIRERHESPIGITCTDAEWLLDELDFAECTAEDFKHAYEVRKAECEKLEAQLQQIREVAENMLRSEEYESAKCLLSILEAGAIREERKNG